MGTCCKQQVELSWRNLLDHHFSALGYFLCWPNQCLGACSGTGKEVLNPSSHPSSKNLHSQKIPIKLNVLTILCRLEMLNILKFSNVLHVSKTAIFSSWLIKTKQNKTKNTVWFALSTFIYEKMMCQDCFSLT